MIKIDDIFGDGYALKRMYIKGCSNSKPEKTSKIFFDYKLIVDDKEIHSSSEKGFQEIEEE